MVLIIFSLIRTLPQIPLPKGQLQHQEKRYFQCNKGCGQEIYFDVNNKSQSGKYIP
jgi:hypothetical protein